MSSSEAAGLDIEALASELARRCADAVESGALDAIPDREVGRVLVEMLRVLAAKAQAGRVPPLMSGNSRLAATDAVIAATAVLESVGVEVFELAAWQAVTGVGSSRHGANRQTLGDSEQ